VVVINAILKVQICRWDTKLLLITVVSSLAAFPFLLLPLKVVTWRIHPFVYFVLLVSSDPQWWQYIFLISHKLRSSFTMVWDAAECAGKGARKVEQNVKSRPIPSRRMRPNIRT